MASILFGLFDHSAGERARIDREAVARCALKCGRDVRFGNIGAAKIDQLCAWLGLWRGVIGLG